MRKISTDTNVIKNIDGKIGISNSFALLSKLVTRDLNNYKNSPMFSKFNKDKISGYLANPYQYEKELRQAINFIYGASTHFRRIVQYFTSLTDLAFIISPHGINPDVVNIKSMQRNYRKVSKMMSAMNVKTQFPKIIKVCMREDTFFGTIWPGQDNITIQQLPSNYCKISSIEGNVLNVTFDFSYFDIHKDLLEFYPPEFKHKYENIYLKRKSSKWIELDCPYSFAIKCADDILEYSIPPFAGLLREVYDIEDYKALKLTKNEIENYALLAMKLPMDEEGNWLMDLTKAEEFWRNLDAVMPEEVGSVLTPMDIEKIDFDKSNTGDTNSVAEAENSLFTAAGVSSLLFNNEKASANALLLSIKADQEITFGIVRSIEDMVNRYIQSFSYGKNFKVSFLDCSIFNRKEVGDAYLKAASYGLPTISMYAASQGLNQSELDNMSFLETTVLKLQEKFKPIISSTQLSSDALESNAATDEGGAPQKDIGDLSDSGEGNRESA